ncbi:MAG TPA: hypothetical protein VM734_18400 [Kofleriaceae bacterium]|nr:hypothetical protein [Kofleriaceae bacterium]
MAVRPRIAALLVALVVSPLAAHADVELTLRAGGTTLDLPASSETPFVGSRLDDALAAYNGAALAFNAMHGYGAGSPQAAPMASADDVGLRARLLVLTPSLDVSAGPLRARLDVPVGLGDGLRTVGVAVYPMGLAFARERAAVVPFVLAGGGVSVVDDGDRGGALFELRVVGGVRFGRVWFELGVRPYLAGGAIDRARLDRLMETYDPRGPAAPPPPEEVVRGGVGRAIDVALGVSL